MKWFFLHGFMGGPSSWDEVLAHLPSVEAFRPWLPGHGEAVPDPTLATFSDALESLLRSIKEPEPYHLVGYSMGARLALGLALRAPHHFSRMTLIGGSPGLPGVEDRRLRRSLDEDRAQLLLQQGLETFVAAWEELPLFETQKHLPTHLQAQQRALRRSHRPDGLAHALRVLGTGGMPNYWPRLGELDLPVQVIVGEQDAKYLEVGQRMVQRLPQGRLRIVRGAGHNVVLEAPEALAAELVDGIEPSG